MEISRLKQRYTKFDIDQAIHDYCYKHEVDYHMINVEIYSSENGMEIIGFDLLIDSQYVDIDGDECIECYGDSR